jgi:membrane protein implicated in regulation of membrane protease activity
MSYFIWLILSVIAFVVEMMLPTFFSLFAGIGFLGAGASISICDVKQMFYTHSTLPYIEAQKNRH